MAVTTSYAAKELCFIIPLFDPTISKGSLLFLHTPTALFDCDHSFITRRVSDPQQPTSDHPVADVQESPTTPLPFCKIDHQASTRSSLTQPSVIVISPKMGDYVKGNKNVEVARESDEKLQLKKPMLEMVYKTRRSFKRFTQIMLEKKNSV